jgi:hypothetical protein
MCRWRDRFLAFHCAIIYYWILVVSFLVSPKYSYKFSELLETHAVSTYRTFLVENEAKLRQIPAPKIAQEYYKHGDLYMFDADSEFVRDATGEYINTRHYHRLQMCIFVLNCMVSIVLPCTKLLTEAANEAANSFGNTSLVTLCRCIPPVRNMDRSFVKCVCGDGSMHERLNTYVSAGWWWTGNGAGSEIRRPPVDNLYDIFTNILDDEWEHVKTMVMCQDYDSVEELMGGTGNDTEVSDASDEKRQAVRAKWKTWANSLQSREHNFLQNDASW